MGEPEDPAVQGANKAFEGPEETEREVGTGTGVRADSSHEDTPPDDAGESKRRSSEDIANKEDEEGRTTEGTQGASGRPYGKIEPEGSSGVDPQGSVTEGPNLPPP